MYNRGLIKTIIVIVIGLIVLGYFGFNIEDIIKSPNVQSNLNAAWNFIEKIWNNYLAGPVIYVWDKFVVGVLWKFIEAGLSNIN